MVSNMRIRVWIGLLLVALLMGPLVAEVAYSEGAETVSVIIGIKPSHDYLKAKNILKSYGALISDLPEIRAVLLKLPRPAIEHARRLPFVSYVEEDTVVEVLGVSGRTIASAVKIISYTEVVKISVGEAGAVGYTLQNSEKTTVGVYVRLLNHSGKIVAEKYHELPRRSKVSDSLSFLAPTTPNNYTWRLEVVSASSTTLYDSKLVTVIVVGSETPSPDPSQQSPGTSLTYTDTLTWNVRYVKAPNVWHTYNTSLGIHALGYGVKVAVLDTGIDYTHPELQKVVTWCARYLSSGVDTYEGYNLSYCYDGHGHGTFVTGIIAAQLNNASIAGVAPFVEVYAVKVVKDDGYGTVYDLAKGIIEAVKGPDNVPGTSDDADVISMSISTSVDSQTLYNAITYAVGYGAVLVAAAGNKGATTPSYPAAYPEVIAVGAIDANYNVPSWSNRNPDIVAPGVSTVSTTRGGGIGTGSGTSYACPHVSGVVALIQALRMANGLPKLDAYKMEQLLKDTAVDLGNTGYDELYGYGLVNAYNAATKALSIN